MHKKTLQLAVPNIISNLTVPILGAVDLAMMGTLNNLEFMGAIALGAMIFNFIYWGLGFLRMGTCGFTAQAYGSQNWKEASAILGRGLFIALIGASLLLLLQKPIMQIAFHFITASPELQILTTSYFNIRIWGAFAAITAFVFCGWFIGMQNTKIPMWIAIAINLCNIAFNYYFIFIKGMGPEGVALGTVLAQYIGLVLAIFCIFYFFRTTLKQWAWKLVLDLKSLKHFAHINSDIFLRTTLLIFVFSFFTTKSSAYGNEVLVMNTILYQFFIFFSYGMDGFAHASEALTGKFFGQKNMSNLKLCIRTVFIWGIAMSLIFTLAYALLYNSIISIFTKDANLLVLAQPYFFWILSIPLLSFPAFLLDGIYAGALATKKMLHTMVIAVSLFFFPSYYILAPYIGNHALWLALVLFLIARGIFMISWLKSAIINKIPFSYES